MSHGSRPSWEAGEAPHPHPHRQIRALGVARGDVREVELAGNERTRAADALAGAVLALGGAGNSPARGTVQPDGVDLVEIRHRPVPGRDVTDCGDGRDVGIHRINGLKRDQLWRANWRFLQQRLEMRRIIVPEDPARRFRPLDSGDHRGVILFIGKHDPRPVRPRHRFARGFLFWEAAI